MINFVLWYLIAGAAILVLYSITTYIGIVIKYGPTVSLEAVLRVNAQMVEAHTVVERIWQWLIGFICWPIRLSEAPGKIELIWDECEVVKKEFEELKEKDVIDVIKGLD